MFGGNHIVTANFNKTLSQLSEIKTVAQSARGD